MVYTSLPVQCYIDNYEKKHNNNNYGKYYLITRSVFNNLIPVYHQRNTLLCCTHIKYDNNNIDQHA